MNCVFQMDFAKFNEVCSAKAPLSGLDTSGRESANSETINRICYLEIRLNLFIHS